MTAPSLNKRGNIMTGFNSMHIESFDRYSNDGLPDTIWFEVNIDAVLHYIYVLIEGDSFEIDSDNSTYQDDPSDVKSLLSQYFVLNPGDLHA